MIWFEYKFISSLEIFKNIKLISEYSIIDFLALAIWLIFIVWLVIYLIPTVKIYTTYSAEASRKKKNTKMLKRMALQRNIEDEIARELKTNA
jgi:uncharacterized membrane protein YcfT